MSKRRHHIIRTIQLALAVLSFPIVTIYCWHITGFNMNEIQLSYFGVNSKVQWYWNLLVILLSYFMWYNINMFINDHPRINNRIVWKILFGFSLVNLVLVGIIPMNEYFHSVAAYLYFFSFPLIIFSFGFLERKRIRYRESLSHMVISLFMMIIPLTMLAFWTGKAIAEIAHSIFLILWNLYVYLKHLKKS